MYTSGFRRVMIVNGHGGNAAVGNLCRELMAERPDTSLKFHNWWTGPRVIAEAKEIAPNPSHANWFENFPWTRLANVSLPQQEKPPVDIARLKLSGPAEARRLLGDGSFGGAYQQSDADMAELWAVGVAETRDELERPWPNRS
jgi:creatinine amidohydrolase